MNFKKVKNVYMIGIKGVGMTMLAQFLVKKGYKVSGSDGPEVYMTDRVLKASKIKVYDHFSVNNLPAKADLIIYSSAYSSDNNMEVAEAIKLKKPVLIYAEALGQIFSHHYGIAVCGSHGKTTTSAWLGYVLWKSGIKPNVLVGSRVPQFKGSALMGSAKYFVAETDEYQNKLKHFKPKMVLLNNIDYDHPDFFKTEKDYVEVFRAFIKKIPKSGFLIANGNDQHIKKIIKSCSCKIIKYDVDKHNNFDFIAYDVKQAGEYQIFSVRKDKKDFGEFKIKLLGEHNIYNALAVITAALQLKVDIKKIKKNISEFAGTERRMQTLGEYKGALIIDDYAHHPTEVMATLSGIRRLYPNKNLITVFHPHTFTRTKALLDEFSRSFSLVDELIVLDIYGSAREAQGGVSSLELVKKIEAFNEINLNKEQIVLHIPTLKEVENYLRKKIKANDLVVLMGAGDVFRIGEGLLKK